MISKSEKFQCKLLVATQICIKVRFSYSHDHGDKYDNPSCKMKVRLDYVNNLQTDSLLLAVENIPHL